jgi:hypothetical protein
MQTAINPQAVARNWKTLVGGLLLPALLATGCSSAPHTAEGAAGGAIVGGVLGTIVGAAVGRPLQGAAIGAAAGGGLGAASGAAEDHRDKKIAQAGAQAAADAEARSQAELTAIAQMTQNKVDETLIINRVRTCGVAFNLTGDQIVWLQQQGVSNHVISEMQATVNYVQQQRVIYTAQPVYVEPMAPAPVVGVGVGVRIR